MSVNIISTIIKQTFKHILFVGIYASICFSAYSNPHLNSTDKVRFSLVYETLKPLELKKSMLSYSEFKKSSRQLDSIMITSRDNTIVPDSVLFDNKWQYPGYFKLTLFFKDKVRTSNTFQYSTENSKWDVFVNDSTIKVKSKLSDSSLTSQSSLKGMVLIVQAVFEMILALLIAHILGFPKVIIIMVLTANIASFPLYLINIPEVFNRELLVFLLKTTVMSLVGMRKLAFYKILILAVILNIISFGFKELLFFLIQML